MEVYIVIRSATGENCANGYLPSGDVLGAFENYQDAKKCFTNQRNGEFEFGDEESIRETIFNEDHIIIINEDDDYALELRIVPVKLS